MDHSRRHQGTPTPPPDGSSLTTALRVQSDIRDGVTREMEEAVAREINACALVDTSAKKVDRALSGVDELQELIMRLAFAQANGEDRPNFVTPRPPNDKSSCPMRAP